MAETPQERLLSVPRTSFVDERTRLAKELKAAGHKDEAAAVAKLQKPTVAAWALNQLARRHADLVKRLGRAGATLRKVQLSGAVGAADRRAFADAVAAQRAALGEARAAVLALLREEGSAAPVHLVEEILRVLRGGAASEEAQARLEEGRFVREPPPEDLALLAGQAVFVPDQTETRKPARAGAREKPGAAAEKAAARERARAHAAAERAVKHRRAAVEKATQLEAQRERALGDARAALAEAEARAAAARAAVETARAALAEAERHRRETSS